MGVFLMPRITNGILATKIDAIVEQMKIQNGRTFKNSTDIAKMKGVGLAVAFIVSAISAIGAYFGIKQ